jgi:hypothetical protein
MEHENCSMLFRNIKHTELSFDFAQIKTIDQVMGKSTMSFSAIYKIVLKKLEGNNKIYPSCVLHDDACVRL